MADDVHAGPDDPRDSDNQGTPEDSQGSDDQGTPEDSRDSDNQGTPDDPHRSDNSHSGDDHGTPGDMVDWDLAVATAKRLMKPGPDISRDEARQAVHELRKLAAQAEPHVREYTQLYAESATAPVLVVDRGGWVQANADGFKQVLRPLIAKM